MPVYKPVRVWKLTHLGYKRLVTKCGGNEFEKWLMVCFPSHQYHWGKEQHEGKDCSVCALFKGAKFYGNLHLWQETTLFSKIVPIRRKRQKLSSETNSYPMTKLAAKNARIYLLFEVLALECLPKFCPLKT